MRFNSCSIDAKQPAKISIWLRRDLITAGPIHSSGDSLELERDVRRHGDVARCYGLYLIAPYRG